ncbi:MAG: SIMPL domain-containing protein, partial [Ignavibacteriaceae bacterium]
MKYLFLIILIFCFVTVNAQENNKYINVNGTSELILPADQINFIVQIKIIDESVSESKKTNDKYLNELLTILKETEINSKDIEVSPITIGNNYESVERERKQKGFYTEVNVSFILKDLSKYYDLTNKLSKNNYFEITNSNYSISDYEVQHKFAYEKALKAAKEKAE